MFHVFGSKGKLTKTLSDAISTHFDKKDNVLLLYSFEYEHIVHSLKPFLVDLPNFDVGVINPTKRTQNMSNIDRSTPSLEIQGLIYQNPTISKILYIGEDSAAFSQLLIEYASRAELFRYSVESDLFESCDEEKTKTARLLNRRYFLVEKAKNVGIFGILIQTLSIDKHHDVLHRIKELITSKGKKYYTFIVGKMNEPKLANFGEIEMYVVIGCGRHSIIDSKQFMRDIVTPYELFLALNDVSWNPEKYSTRFKSILEETFESVVNDEEPRFSLVTGKLVNEKKDVVSSNTDLIHVGQNALMHLEKRSYKGLETKIGETEIAKIEQGRSGIAKGYTHEPDRGISKEDQK
jgi:diphthamide biosynthesis protein 2